MELELLNLPPSRLKRRTHLLPPEAVNDAQLWSNACRSGDATCEDPDTACRSCTAVSRHSISTSLCTRVRYLAASRPCLLGTLLRPWCQQMGTQAGTCSPLQVPNLTKLHLLHHYVAGSRTCSLAGQICPSGLLGFTDRLAAHPRLQRPLTTSKAIPV